MGTFTVRQRYLLVSSKYLSKIGGKNIYVFIQSGRLVRKLF
jgi:hypothetical protein